MSRTILPLLILSFGLMAAWFLPMKRPVSEDEPAAVAAPLVSVIDATPEDLSLSVAAYGTVTPRTEIDLVAEVGGKLVHVAPVFVTGGFLPRANCCCPSIRATTTWRSPGLRQRWRRRGRPSSGSMPRPSLQPRSGRTWSSREPAGAAQASDGGSDGEAEIGGSRSGAGKAGAKTHRRASTVQRPHQGEGGGYRLLCDTWRKAFPHLCDGCCGDPLRPGERIVIRQPANGFAGTTVRIAPDDEPPSLARATLR